MAPDVRPPAVGTPFDQLEQALIDKFLSDAGYDRSTLKRVDAAERDRLLTQASIYASDKLAEVESRWRYVRAIHDGHAE